jgi:galactokinase
MLVRAPGRVNLIGDHTDYMGGLVFPMAIDRYTTIHYQLTNDIMYLSSDDDPDVVEFSISSPFDPHMTPRWGRYVAAVTSLLQPARGIRGTVSTTIPVGAGLSSSAALEVAVARALGSQHSAVDIALLTQKAEHLATGVPTGIMDQLCIASARAGHGTLIDCRSLDVTHIPIPDDIVFVVQFIAHRTLEGSEYATRVSQCSEAEAIIGPLRDATMHDVARIQDPVIAARAQHVISENERVLSFTQALTRGDYVQAGHAMTQSHNSLSSHFATSTTQMDQAVAAALATPGVFGARMTGGGFGGCIVCLCTPETELAGWKVSPAASS